MRPVHLAALVLLLNLLARLTTVSGPAPSFASAAKHARPLLQLSIDASTAVAATIHCQSGSLVRSTLQACWHKPAARAACAAMASVVAKEMSFAHHATCKAFTCRSVQCLQLYRWHMLAAHASHPRANLQHVPQMQTVRLQIARSQAEKRTLGSCSISEDARPSVPLIKPVSALLRCSTSGPVRLRMLARGTSCSRSTSTHQDGMCHICIHYRGVE